MVKFKRKSLYIETQVRSNTEDTKEEVEHKRLIQQWDKPAYWKRF